jgi:hypothetical protein
MSTSARSAYELWYGRDEPPLEARTLCAGPLRVELHGPDLRYVRTASNEVVRRIYVAIRDLNWNTMPIVVGEPEVEDGDDQFRVRFDARSMKGDIDFCWSATIVGTREGTVSYELDGKAGSAFAFAKIGLCLHHPMQETAGRLFRGVAPTTPVGGELPRFIGPQINLPDEGWDLPLFEPAESFEIDLPYGERIRFDFEGDLFEMEDQRNWTDGSFKTSSTPASLGYHHSIKEGGMIRQKLSFHVEGARTTPPRPRGTEMAVLHVGEPLGHVLPPIGLGSASHGTPMTDRETELLRQLAPAHLRVDVRPGELALLKQGLGQAAALDTAVELALFINGDESFVDGVAHVLDDTDVPVARMLVFDDSTEVTPLEQVELVRRRFAGIPIGGGTNVYFNELNRNRPDHEPLDVVAYSVSPQIHAFDELSLIENLEAQGETVRSTRAFSGETPIAVTPITLRPRYNAVAVVAEVEEPGRLPWQVDPRQMSLFGAAWTVGSVKYLAEAGADSLTYYETTGWRGVVELETGSGSNSFPSAPGEPFPLYHVLAQVCAWRGADLLMCTSTEPLSVTALAVRQNGKTSLLVANLEAVAKTVRLDARTIDLQPFEVLKLDA